MKKALILFLLLASPAFGQQAAHRTTFVALATNNALTIKATGGTLFGYRCSNIASAAAMWLKFFDGAPTMGTTSAADNIGIPAGGTPGTTVGEWFGAAGVQFSQGIYTALTGAQPLADNTSVSAGAATCTIYWN